LESLTIGVRVRIPGVVANQHLRLVLKFTAAHGNGVVGHLNREYAYPGYR
jgi:hypothetical protein